MDGCWGCLGMRVAAFAVVLTYITGSNGTRKKRERETAEDSWLEVSAPRFRNECFAMHNVAIAIYG